jgi:hypothetical protein
VLAPNCREFPIVQKEGKRDVNRKIFCIEEGFVTLWLAKISLTPAMQIKNPNAVRKLKAYQIKAAEALHEAFMATKNKKQEFYNELGLEGEIIELKQAVTEMKTTMDKFIDASTINSRQAQKLLGVAKDRVNFLLGGAHSKVYKKWARVYFKNVWNQFAEEFGVSTYKDLSPINMDDGIAFINQWEYRRLSHENI